MGLGMVGQCLYEMDSWGAIANVYEYYCSRYLWMEDGIE